MSCEQPIKTEYIGDVAIDNLESLPDYILAERDTDDQSTGNTVREMVRVPSAKLFPQGNMDNVFALETNNTALTVPANTVRACRITNENSMFIMKYADASHAPVFLALGEQAGFMLCQNSGVVNIPAGHKYIVGQQYYVGANGEPTTTANNYKLFVPVSSTKLVVNM